MVSVTMGDSGAISKRGHLREMGVPILFGAIVLLVSATMLLGANISALHANLNRIEHSQAVLTEIADVENSMMGNELTVRGYALTGNPSFLRLEKAGNVRRDKAISDLQRLMADEPQHAQIYRNAMQAVDLHKANFGKLFGIGPDRAVIVAQAIIDPEIRANSYKTRNLLRELRSSVMGSVAARQRDITAQLFRAFFLAIGIIVAAFVLGGVGVWAAQLNAPSRR